MGELVEEGIIDQKRKEWQLFRHLGNGGRIVCLIVVVALHYVMSSFSAYYWRSVRRKITLSSKLNEGGRGMELSDLVYFNDHLLAADDRTGIGKAIVVSMTFYW